MEIAHPVQARPGFESLSRQLFFSFFFSCPSVGGERDFPPKRVCGTVAFLAHSRNTFYVNYTLSASQHSPNSADGDRGRCAIVRRGFQSRAPFLFLLFFLASAVGGSETFHQTCVLCGARTAVTFLAHSLPPPPPPPPPQPLNPHHAHTRTHRAHTHTHNQNPRLNMVKRVAVSFAFNGNVDVRRRIFVSACAVIMQGNSLTLFFLVEA